MSEFGNILAVSGTDTDAGKSVLTAALLLAALREGLEARAIKAVQSGCPRDAEGRLTAPDALVYAEAAALADLEVTCLRETFPYAADEKTAVRAGALFMLPEPCSPHLAAARQGTSLSVAGIARKLLGLLQGGAEQGGISSSTLLLLEGAGGLLVPLNERETMLDLFIRLGAPVLLAVPNKLGAINHALLSLEALRSRGLRVPGFVLTCPQAPCGEDGDSEQLLQAIREDNRASIERCGALPCLAELPFLPELSAPDAAGRAAGWLRAAEAVRPALKNIAAALKDFPCRPEPCKPESCKPESGGCPARNAARHALGGADSAIGSLHEEDTPARGGLEPEDDLLTCDRRHVWHPYTSALNPLPVFAAERTEGARIMLRDGTALVDGTSSWWCAAHGYNHPHLLRALRAQAARMPHVMFGGLTHEPAVRLAEALLRIVPEGLDRVFFSDSGSVAVEVALKMALQYQMARGKPERCRVLSLGRAYHGDTLGAMSVCDPEEGMHALFGRIMPEQLFAPAPTCRFDREYDGESFKGFAALLREHAQEIGAVIMEPVMQGAGGMWFYHPQYLREARKLCDEHGILLVFDEIASGFGRTGRLFASEWAGVTPDIMCLGKGLTGGVLTLAATLATREVAEGLSREGGVLMHGPTFMANPLACAVAGASLELFSARGAELEPAYRPGGWQARVAAMQELFWRELAPCRELPGVRDLRVLGGVAALEMESPVRVEKAQNFFVRECGVWLRPFGRIIYLMPPYVASEEELLQLCRAARRAVELGVWR